MSKNICKLFYKTLEKNNKNVLGYKTNNNVWKKINGHELSYMINSCNEILKFHKVQKGDRIVYCGNNSVEWVAWNLACYSVGGIWVPIYSNQSNDYCNHIINDCNPKLFITNNKYQNMDNTRTILNTVHKSNKHFNIEDTNSLATLIYTSGTTGSPKGVKLTHNNIVSNIESIKYRFSDLQNYKTVNILPWAHIYSLTCELYYNLLNENETYICNDKTTFIEDCKSIKPNAVFLVPKILELVKNKVEFLDKPYIRLILPYVLKNIFGNNLDLIFMGGAKLDSNVKEFYKENNILICEGYGCTETSPIISVNHHIEPRNEDSVGKILENVDVNIINNEICVSGKSVMEGYWNDDLKTNEKIFTDINSKKWYKTGDSGYIKDEFLYYNGRISENYKLNNGKFVNVSEIECVIKKFVNSNFIVFGENNKHNSLICENAIDNETINKINKEISKELQIKNVIVVTPEVMGAFLTPKLSIKRNKLIDYVMKK